MDELWKKTEASTSIWVWPETKTVLDKHGRELSVADEEKYPPGSNTMTVPGPKVVSVTLRRGQSEDSPVVSPISGGIGTEYEFPASALDGEGPVYVMLRTEEPERRLALRLKSSVLRKP